LILQKAAIAEKFFSTFLFGPNKYFKKVFKQAVLSSLDLTQEPLFASVLKHIRLSKSIALKKKCKIFIKQSFILIGAADPSGLLREGEIYVNTCTSEYSGHQAS